MEMPPYWCRGFCTQRYKKTAASGLEGAGSARGTTLDLSLACGGNGACRPALQYRAGMLPGHVPLAPRAAFHPLRLSLADRFRYSSVHCLFIISDLLRLSMASGWGFKVTNNYQ